MGKDTDMVNPIEVLLVEDSPADVRLTKEALKEEKLHVNLNVVTDGVEAMGYLRREGNYAHAVRPDLILLDLNLPKKDGREVLKEVKGDVKLRSILNTYRTFSYINSHSKACSLLLRTRSP